MSAVAIVLLALAIAADSRRPRLAEIVRSGDDVRALRMLDEGADPNQRDLKGMTPLMWAAVLGQVEVAGRLLDKGAALNAETGGGSGRAANTALTFAAANGNTTMVDFLLSRGAVPDRAADWSGLPEPYRDKLARIAGFVASAAQYINPSTEDFSQVETFLRASPPGGHQGALNEMLWLAAAQGKEEFVDRLLRLGASPLADFRDTMAFEIALRSAGSQQPHRVRTALRLLKAGQPLRVVQRAVRNELAPDAPPELLAAFGDLPAMNATLAEAVARANAPAVRALLARGADPFAVDGRGKRLVDIALASRQTDVIAAFVDAGATVPPVDTPRALLQRIKAGAQTLGSDSAGRIVRAVDWYLGRPSTDAGPEYLRGFEAMASLLEGKPDEATVRDIADDLESKRQFCLRNNVGMGGTVTLGVHTRNAAGEVSRWQVYYLLKIYEHAPDVPPGAFRRWSSPATDTIGPGRYWIWAQDPFTHKTSERKLVDLAGTTRVDVDLPVP